MVYLFVGGQEWFDTYFQHLPAPFLARFGEQCGARSKRKHISYIPASIHNEAMLSGAWTSIAQ